MAGASTQWKICKARVKTHMSIENFHNAQIITMEDSRFRH